MKTIRAFKDVREAGDGRVAVTVEDEDGVGELVLDDGAFRRLIAEGSHLLEARALGREVDILAHEADWWQVGMTGDGDLVLSFRTTDLGSRAFFVDSSQARELAEAVDRALALDPAPAARVKPVH
ncbi:hypothetical protein [Brevundimonas lutea]|uniref:hypothetical protein n=1 Tax=Brevundimonas lutea TaxID=2293980 RepID=UPI000F03AD01|nr:hypothetical protein [Brevundimonas lutea]